MRIHKALVSPVSRNADLTTARQSSVCLLVAMAAIMGFDVWTEDIS